MFEPFVLRHNHRQGEGSEWVETLNRVRKGAFTEHDLNTLRSRIIPAESLDRNSFHITYTNEMVSKYNRKALEEIDAPGIVFIATKSKNYTINQKKGTVDSTSFIDKLELKIGARVKLIFNINTIDELVNGAFGTVIAFGRNSINEIIAIIVKFDQASVGQKHRELYKSISDKYAKENGTPIFKMTFEYLRNSKRVKLIQFPLNLAHSSTAHSAQVKYL